MTNKKSFIFIGEPISGQELTIIGKPSFSDLILLSNQSLQPTMSTPYQSIPLGNHTNLSFRFHDYNIQLSCTEKESLSIQVSEGGHKLSEEEIFEVLNSFAIKEGDKVSFLGLSPYGKKRPRKRRKQRVAAEGKVLGEE